MSEVGLVPGCVIHWKDYKFNDGDTANKYFVILGAKTGRNFLAVIATSQPKKRKFDPGCNASAGYYHIPGGGKDWFPKDTWLLLADPIEILPDKFKALIAAKTIEPKTNIRTDVANAIRNCLKRCEDVSQMHIDLL